MQSKQVQNEREPVAWVIPGDDNAYRDGFIDARVDSEGEFTRPLYAAAPDLQKRVAELEGENERLRSLLGRYVNHVVEEEGADFLDFTEPAVTSDEAAEIEGYARAALEQKL